MALGTIQLTVGSTEVELTTPAAGTIASKALKNTGSVPLFIGPIGVTIETGLPLWPGQQWLGDYLWNTWAPEDSYAIAGPGISGAIAIMESS